MNVLFLPKYSADGASSRYRTYQYLPFFSKSEYTVSPFFSEGYIRCLGNRWKRKIYFVKSLMHRIYVILFCLCKYDLIVVEKELVPYFPPILEYLMLKIRKQYILDFDDAIYCNYQNHQSNIVRSFLGNKIDKITMWAAGIVTGSPELTTYFQKLNRNVIEIPTSIDLSRYELPTINNDSKEFVIGWIGSRSTSQHLDSIADVLIDFILTHSNAKLHLIGYYGKAFENFKNISIIQWDAMTELADILEFTIGIMPLIDRPFEHGKCGFKLIQYMACEKPTISTPFIANLKIDNGNGNLFASTDKEWNECLEWGYNNRASLEEVGKKNRKTVVEKYSIQNNHSKYIDFYNSIVK